MNKAVTIQRKPVRVVTQVAVPVGYPVSGYAEVGYNYANSQSASMRAILKRLEAIEARIAQRQASDVRTLEESQGLRLLKQKCGNCHKEGSKGSAQMQLWHPDGSWSSDPLKYRPQIADKLLSKEMPPNKPLDNAETLKILDYLYE